ncbi:HPP family protein [Roseobacter sp. N2S]|uniref:HPP family protein n=1 Tax=Roseobacter sp. N2S TaxID=2663844 RepID=UPI0028607D6B|nr:HPP family protein [Roseobacter sp. N2S]MDR6264525.1 CBS domain-containing membrane protein [Roseobacter sp. N2S]
MRMRHTINWTQWVRGLGPAISAIPVGESLRAGIGALIGLGAAGLLVLTFADPQHGLILIAPFGASAVLLFGVPNSPLAQPWAALVGNTVSAVVGVTVSLLVPDPTLSVALAVALSMVAMMLTRAVHPPGGAVAMTAALNPALVQDMGYHFALLPVAAGTALLVLAAVIYAQLTGRHYPFRHFDDENTSGTTDAPAMERLGLSEDDLNDILQRYRQSLNLGVEDLARLIGAAQLQAASHRRGPISAADIMSRDLVTVGAETKLSDVADLFRQHGFTTLPVIGKDDSYLGVIFQIHLIRRAREDALRGNRRFSSALRRLMTADGASPVRAGQIMAVTTPCVSPDTPLAALLPILAEGSCDAVPVLESGRIVGIVTRNDLIAALASESLRQG